MAMIRYFYIIMQKTGIPAGRTRGGTENGCTGKGASGARGGAAQRMGAAGARRLCGQDGRRAAAIAGGDHEKARAAGNCVGLGAQDAA